MTMDPKNPQPLQTLFPHGDFPRNHQPAPILLADRAQLRTGKSRRTATGCLLYCAGRADIFILVGLYAMRRLYDRRDVNDALSLWLLASVD
ncbi:uncharacterized protein BO97DRAFT_156721 [Aspergillus homomorphus CBS 101889]|uniref:Uncharacterized protein n=1 Tax=Aspergillus homomorphus (strain CBS 101889) TaxID=1450537 RepID=A0A395HPZ2_ASPHC|nr:hypothetical protein BO97DRAFT_156721 [Aspergillus homomorphus CBS 101889]RAL09887.1 hypothetical protein BO97DRAFT_156721 [Aspergillus homomorphus CBS 101889]